MNKFKKEECKIKKKLNEDRKQKKRKIIAP